MPVLHTANLCVPFKCTNVPIQCSNSSLYELYEHSYPPNIGNTSENKPRGEKSQLACPMIGETESCI